MDSSMTAVVMIRYLVISSNIFILHSASPTLMARRNYG